MWVRAVSLTAFALIAGVAWRSTPRSDAAPHGDDPPASETLAPRVAFTQAIAGTTLSIDFVPVTLADGRQLWMSRTEIPWEVLDVCVYGFDQVDGKSESVKADAVTRPTKPYIATDRGFGHAGWPANSVSFKNAVTFCEWLSAKSGCAYRLPREAEWIEACARSGVTVQSAPDFAWFEGNSGGTTHRVGSKRADAQGIHDLWGNLAEWCVLPDGRGAVFGGSYRDSAAEIGCASRHADTPRWNQSDPQMPKSIWWLADAGWIGFRVVCDAPPNKSALTPSKPAAPK